MIWFSRRSALDEVAIQRTQWVCTKDWRISIYVSLLASYRYYPLVYSSSSGFDLTDELTWLILSAAQFCVGLAEDLGYDMSPKFRLVSSAVSSLVAIMLLSLVV